MLSFFNAKRVSLNARASEVLRAALSLRLFA
jgi:hypothetical protein